MAAPTTTKAPPDDPYRPRFHFTPPHSWMNDPNGLVYQGGRWHLFYQHNPFGATWGHMHWGHAESPDLVGWRHLPIALAPDPLGTIFSGTVAFDRANTSGLFRDSEGGLVAVFTYFKYGLQRQAVAFSADGGLTWEKYPKNPVIRNPLSIHFRDPKVFWHKETGRWVMILTLGGRLRFYRSADLLGWEPAGEFGRGAGAHGGVWECPDLFELPIDGDPEKKRWVMLVSVKGGAPGGGSGTQYFIGEFDGTRFVNADPPGRILWLDHGPDNYAGITFAEVPEADGRRIFVGWMNNWRYAQKTPTAPWRGAMTVPRVLRLTETPGGAALVSVPVAEIEGIRTGGHRLEDERITGQRAIRGRELSGGAYEVAAEWEVGRAAEVGISLTNDGGDEVVIGYDRTSGSLYLDRTRSGITRFSRHFPARFRAPLDIGDGRLSLRVLVDRSSVEVFADGGRAVITALVFPRAPLERLELFSRGGASSVSSLSLWALDRQNDQM